MLGTAADAVAADDFGAARAAVAALKQADGGRAAIVLGDWPVTDPRDGTPLPAGARWALDLVEAPGRLRGAMTALLAHVVVVDDLNHALDVVSANPGLRAVTTDGDLVGPGWSPAGRTASRARSRSPPRSRRPVPSWPARRRDPPN